MHEANLGSHVDGIDIPFHVGHRMSERDYGVVRSVEVRIHGGGITGHVEVVGEGFGLGTAVVIDDVHAGSHKLLGCAALVAVFQLTGRYGRGEINALSRRRSSRAVIAEGPPSAVKKITTHITNFYVMILRYLVREQVGAVGGDGNGAVGSDHSRIGGGGVGAVINHTVDGDGQSGDLGGLSVQGTVVIGQVDAGTDPGSFAVVAVLKFKAIVERKRILNTIAIFKIECSGVCIRINDPAHIRIDRILIVTVGIQPHNIVVAQIGKVGAGESHNHFAFGCKDDLTLGVGNAIHGEGHAGDLGSGFFFAGQGVVLLCQAQIITDKGNTADGIAAVFVRRAHQEQLVRGADGALVAVGHVHQIVLTLQGDHVPHVATRAGAAGHGAAGADTIQAAQIAQVLEGLGIALADNGGIRVAVKDGDQLPGVAVGGAVIVRCRMVVGGSLADIIFVGKELFIGGLGSIGRYHSQGIVSGSGNSGNIGGHRILGGLVILRHPEGKSQVGDHSLRPGDHTIQLLAGKVHAIGSRSTAGLGLVKPVQVIGAVSEQRIHDGAGAELGFEGFLHLRGIRIGEGHFLVGPDSLQSGNPGHRKGGAAAIGRNVFDLNLQCIIDALLYCIQAIPSGSAEGGHLIAIELCLGIEGKELVIFRRIRLHCHGVRDRHGGSCRDSLGFAALLGGMGRLGNQRQHHGQGHQKAEHPFQVYIRFHSISSFGKMGRGRCLSNYGFGERSSCMITALKLLQRLIVGLLHVLPERLQRLFAQPAVIQVEYPLDLGIPKCLGNVVNAKNVV